MYRKAMFVPYLKFGVSPGGRLSFLPSLILSFLGTDVKGHRGREGQVMERVCRGVDIVPDHRILAT